MNEKTRGHVGAWDFVRVFCVGMVGFFHIWQQSWRAPEAMLPLVRTGYLWVDGLILLSGFLLYLPYAEYAEGGRTPESAREFYRRRAARILPGYLFSLLVMLLAFALPERAYTSAGAMMGDLAAHVTFTHTLFRATYHGTPLGGALWTLGVEVQFYLLFPLVARAFGKKPLATYAVMAAAAAVFRGVALRADSRDMLFNQLPAFLDVYANGLVCAALYVRLRNALHDAGGRRQALARLAYAGVCAASALLMWQLVLLQAAEGDIQAGQLARRFPLSVYLGAFIVCAPLTPGPLRALFGNPVTRFLSGISFQFYIWHQTLAVRLKAWGIPPAQSAEPWRGEITWQNTYNLICLLCALAVSVLLTYGVEKPCAKWILSQKKRSE